MLCVAILGASGIAVLQAFSLALKLQLRGADLCAASGLAQEKLQELSFMENHGEMAPILGGGSGEKGKFSWEYRFAADEELKLQRMLLSLRWENRNTPEEFSLSSYFIDEKK